MTTATSHPFDRYAKPWSVRVTVRLQLDGEPKPRVFTKWAPEARVRIARFAATGRLVRVEFHRSGQRPVRWRPLPIERPDGQEA